MWLIHREARAKAERAMIQWFCRHKTNTHCNRLHVSVFFHNRNFSQTYYRQDIDRIWILLSTDSVSDAPGIHLFIPSSITEAPTKYTNPETKQNGDENFFILKFIRFRDYRDFDKMLQSEYVRRLNKNYACSGFKWFLYLGLNGPDCHRSVIMGVASAVFLQAGLTVSIWTYICRSNTIGVNTRKIVTLKEV